MHGGGEKIKTRGPPRSLFRHFFHAILLTSPQSNYWSVKHCKNYQCVRTDTGKHVEVGMPEKEHISSQLFFLILLTQEINGQRHPLSSQPFRVRVETPDPPTKFHSANWLNFLSTGYGNAQTNSEPFARQRHQYLHSSTHCVVFSPQKYFNRIVHRRLWIKVHEIFHTCRAPRELFTVKVCGGYSRKF